MQDVEARLIPMPSITLDNRSHIAINGDEAEHFLHNLVTTDIAGLPAGALRPGALLTAQGKVLFAFLIFRRAEGFVLEVASQDAVSFAKRLKFFRLRARVNIADPEPVSVTAVWDEPRPSDDFLRDARFGKAEVWHGSGTRPGSVAHGHWTRLRIENGVAEPHMDYTYGDVFPHDINLDQTAGLSFSKGCYVGQEVVSRMHHRSTARWRLMVAKGEALRQGDTIIANGKPAGAIGSATNDNALALVRLDRIKNALDNDETILAGDQRITLNFPNGVSYDWPNSLDLIP
jgi:tRNA-modifying protein YgfZ